MSSSLSFLIPSLLVPRKKKQIFSLYGTVRYGRVGYGTVPYRKRKEKCTVAHKNRTYLTVPQVSVADPDSDFLPVPDPEPGVKKALDPGSATLRIKKKGTVPSYLTRKLVANKEKRYGTVIFDKKTRGE
jgi:hypothetical protein